MGMLNKIKDKAGPLTDKALGLVGKNSTKVKNGIAKAGHAVDTRTHGKYSRHIHGAQTKASAMVDKIERKNGNGPVGPTSPPAT